MKHRHMSMLEIVVRLIISMLIVILSWLTNFFPLYPLGVFVLVTALSGYCPFNSLIETYLPNKTGTPH